MLTQRRPQAAPNGTNRQPRSASPLPAAPSVHPAALRRTRRRRRTPQATTWPQQAPPPPHAAARARPRSRCSDSCRAPPRLALYALPALAPRCTHHDWPCNQASGGEQPSLPPPGRGDAAPSSPPAPVISPLICAPQQFYAVRSDLYIGVVLEITTSARGQEMGTRTEIFLSYPPSVSH